MASVGRRGRDLESGPWGHLSWQIVQSADQVSENMLGTKDTKSNSAETPLPKGGSPAFLKTEVLSFIMRQLGESGSGRAGQEIASVFF